MVTEQFGIYKCLHCGNVVKVLHPAAGELICCSSAMRHMRENTVDAAQEKHLPQLSRTESSLTAQVGSIPHPMEEQHYIEWIELLEEGRLCRQLLAPGQAPRASFSDAQPPAAVREFCNLHGLWRTQE